MAKVKVKAKVLRALDGDTIEVKLKVRLSEIDAMETKGIEAPQGALAKEWMQKRLEGKEVFLEATGNDIYRRLLAVVWDGTENINDKLLENRLAEKYSPKNHNNGILDV